MHIRILFGFLWGGGGYLVSHTALKKIAAVPSFSSEYMNICNNTKKCDLATAWMLENEANVTLVNERRFHPRGMEVAKVLDKNYENEAWQLTHRLIHRRQHYLSHPRKLVHNISSSTAPLPTMDMFDHLLQTPKVLQAVASRQYATLHNFGGDLTEAYSTKSKKFAFLNLLYDVALDESEQAEHGDRPNKKVQNISKVVFVHKQHLIQGPVTNQSVTQHDFDATWLCDGELCDGVKESVKDLGNQDAEMLSHNRTLLNSDTQHHHKLLILLRTGSSNSTSHVQSIKQTWASGLADGQLRIMEGNERCLQKYGDNHWEGLTCLEATNHIEIMNSTLTNFTWLLIVDDDTYVVVDRLTNLLDRLDPHQPAAFGTPYCGNCGKNRTGFCGGGGYFISRTNLLRMAGLRDRPVLPSVAHAFIEHFMQEPDRVWCDVRFGCVAQDMGLRLINQPGLYGNPVKDENEEKRIIRLEEGYPPLVFHKVSNHSQMHRIHDLVVDMTSKNGTWTKIVEVPDWQE